MIIIEKLVCNMSEKVSYKQIIDAREVNFISFLLENYPHHIVLDKKSNVYIHPEHDSLKYYEKGYFHFSRGNGGDSIRYLTDEIGKSFQEAVKELCQFAEIQNDEFPQLPKKKEEIFSGIYADMADLVIDTINNVNDNPDVFELPKRHKNNDMILAYLSFTRALDKDLLDMLINENLLYEDVRHNAVFVNYNKDFAFLRGCNRSFQRIIGKGLKYWYFSIGENPTDLYITESPIDAISLCQLKNKCPGIYVAMCGLKCNTFEKIIEDFPNFNYNIALDWDDAAQKFIKKYAPIYYKKTNSTVLVPVPERKKLGKDWNDVVVMEYGIKERKKYEKLIKEDNVKIEQGNGG